MSPIRPLDFYQLDRTPRKQFKAASRVAMGFYYVSVTVDGNWNAEHTIFGNLGIFRTKELAMQACSEEDAKRDPLRDS